MISILIADDHKVFSEVFRKVLAGNPGFHVAGVCNDSNSAIEFIGAEKPDIVFMDTNIKPIPAAAATRMITAANAAKVIGLSMHAHPFYISNMLAAGALGYVTKNSPEDEIFHAVMQVAKGCQYICNESAAMLQAEELPVESISAAASRANAGNKDRRSLKNMAFYVSSLFKKATAENFRRLDV